MKLSPVEHPGPRARNRLATICGRGITRRATLPPGRPLMDALAGAVASTAAEVGVSCTSGFAEFHGGTLSDVSYCYPTLGTAAQPMPYGDTVVARDAQIIAGSAVIGRRVLPDDGGMERWSHLHLLWKDSTAALRAGHLWPETKTGSPPVTADITVVTGMDFVNAIDPETQLPVFHARRAHLSDCAEPRRLFFDCAFTRVAPNVEIHAAITEVCRRAGWARARVRAGTGSLIGATLEDPVSGARMQVDGTATEVVTLSGVHVEGERLHLDATLIGSRGAVVSGRLSPTGNIVAATYDLILERLDPA